MAVALQPVTAPPDPASGLIAERDRIRCRPWITRDKTGYGAGVSSTASNGAVSPSQTMDDPGAGMWVQNWLNVLPRPHPAGEVLIHRHHGLQARLTRWM